MKRQILLGLSVLVIAGTLMPTITNAERKAELTIDPDALRRSAQSAYLKDKDLALKNKEAKLAKESDSITDYDLWMDSSKDQNAINKLRNNPMQPYMCERLEKEAIRKFDRGDYFGLADSSGALLKYFDKNSARLGKCGCKFDEESYKHPRIDCEVPIYYKSLIYKGK